MSAQIDHCGRSHLLDDANWTRIPVFTSASVVAHARDMCTRPPEELDTRARPAARRASQFYLDRNRSPIEYAFVHETWSRAGFRAGDPRCVFRGVELSNADETYSASTTRRLPNCAARCCHLTDATMRGYYDEIVDRGIRFIHG